MLDLTPKGRIEDLRIRGQDIRENLADDVVGPPALDLSTQETSQLTFTVYDPDFRLLRSGLFVKRSLVTWLELEFEVAAVETGGAAGMPIVGVTARSKGIQKLRRQFGARLYKNSSPTDLVRRLGEDVGLKVVAQKTSRKSTVGRLDPKGGTPESSWDAILRMAREVGFWAFEAAGVLYFGAPSWLIKRGRDFTVAYLRPGRHEMRPTQVPTCRRSVDARSAATVDLALGYDQGGKVRPGHVLNLRGVPTFGGDYIITGVSMALDNLSDVSVSAATPIDPEPEPPDSSSRDSELGSGTDPTGKGLSDEGFIWPAQGVITGHFGDPRYENGVLDHIHEGIDIACAIGTPVVAAKAGRVSFAGSSSGYGSLVTIDHGGGQETRYGHLSRFACSAGAEVAQGRVVAYSGNTGTSSGPHLHFETRFGGAARDPLDYLP